MMAARPRCALRVALVTTFVAGAAAPAFATPLTLEGISVGGASASGVATGYDSGEWDTGVDLNNGSQTVGTAYLATGSESVSPSFLNTAEVANLGVSLAAPGSYTFTVYGPAKIGANDLAIDFFFGSATAPGISASVGYNSAAFSTASGSTVPLNESVIDNHYITVPAASSLSYDNGSYTATLTALAAAYPFSGQQVGDNTLTGSGGSNQLTAATFTLDVTADSVSAAPEPASVGLLAAGIGGLGAVRRRRAGAPARAALT